MMKKDIENRTDIEYMVISFYEKVKVDPVIGHIFTDIAKVDWPRPLPIMFDFWEKHAVVHR
jgi:hemoglobin